MRAVIHDGKVVNNVIVYDPDSDWQPPEGMTLDTDPPRNVTRRWLVEEDGSYTEPPAFERTPSRRERVNSSVTAVIDNTPAANSIAALREQVIALAEAVELLTGDR